MNLNNRHCKKHSAQESQPALHSQELCAQTPLRLWELLAEQTRRYTMGDNSSVRVEVAGELYSSICMCIQMELRHGDGAQSDFARLFEAGVRRAGRLAWRSRALLEALYSCPPPRDNRSYRDTLTSLPSFFHRYGPRFFAHQIPCDIDYQPAEPVPRGLEGVQYIDAYLRSLLVENRFCSPFDGRVVTALLQAGCPDYDEQLINLFEPVLASACALWLLGREPSCLDVGESGRVELRTLLSRRNAQQAADLFDSAALHLARQAGLADRFSIQYLHRAAASLAIRARAAADNRLDLLLPSPLWGAPEGMIQFADGALLPEEKLRELIDELQDCRHPSDKLAMLRLHIHSISDLHDLLQTCFYGDDELFPAFALLQPVETAVLLHRLPAHKDPAALGNALRRYVGMLPPRRRWEILSLQKSLTDPPQ